MYPNLFFLCTYKPNVWYLLLLSSNVIDGVQQMIVDLRSSLIHESELAYYVEYEF